MIKSRSLIALLIVACVFATLTATGCSSTTRSFDVTVRNDTSYPVMLWLTKNGPPEEDRWVSPETLASSDRPRSPLPGAVVQPGQKLATDTITGKFPSGTSAILRLYAHATHLTELPDIPAPAPGRRRDIVLQPGDNKFIVSDNPEPLSVKSVKSFDK
jgi:hypothetical protein